MAKIPPWPSTVAMLPLKGGTGIRSDSAALCADGRVIYVWVNGNEAYQCHYSKPRAFRAAENSSATVGVALSSLVSTPGQGFNYPITTVWKHPSTGDLFLFVSHFEIQAGGQWQWRTLVYRSSSNNGESAPGVPDWYQWGTVQDLVTVSPVYFGWDWSAAVKTIGEPYVTGSGRLVLPAPNYAVPELGGTPYAVARNACWTSDNTGVTWTLRYEVAYPATSQGGHGTSRNIVSYAGKLWWSSNGNVDDPKSAWSANSGTSWTGFVVPGTDNSVVSAPLTASVDGVYLLMGGVLYGTSTVELSPDPPNTSRASRTVVLIGLPGAGNGEHSRCILQRIGDHDYFMYNGSILVSDQLVPPLRRAQRGSVRREQGLAGQITPRRGSPNVFW